MDKKTEKIENSILPPFSGVCAPLIFIFLFFSFYMIYKDEKYISILSFSSMMRTALKKGDWLPFSSTIGACCPIFVYFIYWGLVVGCARNQSPSSGLPQIEPNRTSRVRRPSAPLRL
jgi:hypothetical protein